MIRRDGMAPVARALRVSRTSLSSYIASTAREGTAVLVELRYGELAVAAEAAK